MLLASTSNLTFILFIRDSLVRLDSTTLQLPSSQADVSIPWDTLFKLQQYCVDDMDFAMSKLLQ